MASNRRVLQIFNYYSVWILLSLIQLCKHWISDANINAQHTAAAAAAAANQRLMYSSNNSSDLASSSNNPFRSDCENPSKDSRRAPIDSIQCLADDLLNDNTNMSTVSLSSKTIHFILLRFCSLMDAFYSDYRQRCTTKQYLKIASRLAR